MDNTTTTHTPDKLRAGRYRYRDIIIDKVKGRGFTFTAHLANGSWFYVPTGGTLKQALAEVDYLLDIEGYAARRGGAWQMEAN